MLWSTKKYLPVVITNDTWSIRFSILSSEIFPKNKIVAHKSIKFNSRHNVGKNSEVLIHTLVIIPLIYHTYITFILHYCLFLLNLTLVVNMHPYLG